MFESESIQSAPSNSAAARSCSENSSIENRSKFFHVMVEFICDKNGAYELHLLTGESERTCAYWLAGTREPPASVFMVLLGEVGRKLV